VTHPLLRDVAAGVLHWSRWSEPRRRLRGKLSIATFHRVLPSSARAEYPLGELAVTPEELSEILESLCTSFTCMTLGEAAERWRRGDEPERPLLALTFDDGQLDNATIAAPVLDARGLRATFFVVSEAAASGRSLWHDRVAFALPRALEREPEAARRLLAELGAAATAREPAAVVGAAKQMATTAREHWVSGLEEAAGGAWRPVWDGMMCFSDLRELRARGHEIGSHSFSHPLLPQCTDAEIEREVVESKRRLEAEVGGAVTSFCYPNGDWDGRARDAVRQAGYSNAVTTQHGWNARGGDVFTLRRCDLTYMHCVDRRGRFSRARLELRLARTGV